MTSLDDESPAPGRTSLRKPEPTLSQADIDAIAEAIEERLVKTVTTNVGRGVLALVWKAILTALILIAAYGMLQSGKPNVEIVS